MLFHSSWFMSLNLKSNSFVGSDELRKNELGDWYYAVKSKVIRN